MALDLHNAIAVNQKLGFARILIDSAQALSQDESIPVRHTIHAYLDGACGQLHHALLHFLYEIAEHDKTTLKVPGCSLQATAAALSELGINNALLQEINDLLTTPSWLQDLIESNNNPQYLAGLFEPTQARTVNSQSSKNMGHSLLATDKSPSIGPLPRVRLWLTNIQNLVERQRSQAVEE